MYDSMTQMTWTSSGALGTANSKMPVTGIRIADSSSHGRALPSRVRVRSISCPMTTLVTASMILEAMGNTIRNAPPHTPVSFRTSV